MRFAAGSGGAVANETACRAAPRSGVWLSYARWRRFWNAYECHVGLICYAAPMPKTSLSAEHEMRQLNVKLAPEDASFVQEGLRQQLGVPYNAEAVREVIAQLRIWFRLPAYVVARLKWDADVQKLHLVAYLQMLLLRRYEELQGGEHASRRSAFSAKPSRR